MSNFKIFDIAGSAMAAQSVRLNTTASNMANASSTAGKAENAYRARQPVFQTVMGDATSNSIEAESTVGVRVTDVIQSDAPLPRVYQPGHPEADADGYVYTSNVNVVDEMVNMISAARTYQSNIEVLNTSKDLLLRTLTLGQ